MSANCKIQGLALSPHSHGQGSQGSVSLTGEDEEKEAQQQGVNEHESGEDHGEA